MTRPLVPLERLRSTLPDDAVAALDEMLGELSADPTRIARLFPAAARRTARGDLGLADADGRAVLAEDAVRVELFLAAMTSLAPEQREAEAAALYRFGDADEKRATLLGLGSAGDLFSSIAILEDALRTNDTRLVAAAMGPHAARLDGGTWRQGVLKCLFVGVPFEAIAGLDVRADPDLADMIARYAHERVAAGRDVPTDVWRVLDRFPDSVALIDLDAELASEHDDRRDAARRLLAGRPTSGKET